MKVNLKSLQRIVVLSTLFSSNFASGAGIDLVNNQTVAGGGGGDPIVGDWVRFRNDVILNVGTGGAADLGISDGVTPVVIPAGLSAAIEAGTPDKGTLNFVGNSIVPGGIGIPAEMLKAISIDPANASIVTFNGNIHLSEDVTYGLDAQEINLNANAAVRKFNFNNTDSILNLSPGITVNGQIDNAVANNGTINFIDNVAGGTTTVTGKIGDTQPIKVVNVGIIVPNKITAYLQADSKADSFRVSRNTVLKLGPNVMLTGKIDGGGGGGLGRGNLLIENNAVVNGDINANKIEINGGVAQLNGAIATFDQTSIAVGATLQAGIGINIFSKIEGPGSIDTIRNATFFGQIGKIAPPSLIKLNSVGGGFNNITFTSPVRSNEIRLMGNGLADTIAEFRDTNEGKITTIYDNKNIVNFRGAQQTGDIGAKNFIFREVSAIQNKDMTLNGNLWAQTLLLSGDHILNIENGFDVNANVTTKTLNEGEISFLGDSQMVGQVGTPLLPLKMISTQGIGVTTFQNDLFAVDTSIRDQSTFSMIADNKTITSNISTSGAGSTLNLAGNQLNVIGDVIISPNDTLAIDLTTATKGLLNVNGNVTTTSGLAGTKLSVNTGSPLTGYIASQELDIIKATAAGALKTIDSVIELNPSAILSFNTLVLPDGPGEKLRLFVIRNNTLNLLNINPGPQLEQAAAEGRLTPGLATIMTELQNLDTEDEVADALRTLGPNISNAHVENMIQSFNARTDVVTKRLEIARNGVVGYNAGDALVGENGVWGAVLGRHFHDKRPIQGYQANYIQPMLGFDKAINHEWLLGAAIGYGATHVRYDLARSFVDIKSLQLLGYASWDSNAWFADGILAFGYSRNNQERTILLPNTRPASAIYYAREALARARIGYEHRIHDWTVKPSVSLKYGILSIDDYIEMNADAANLEVKNKDVNFLTIGAGVKLQYAMQAFRPEIRAAVYQDLIRDRQETMNTFVDSTVVFELNGFKRGSNTYELGAGLEVFKIKHLLLNVNYDYNFRSQFSSHSVFGKLRYEWG